MITAAILLLIGGFEGEICFQTGAILQCPPGDLGYAMDNTGFSTEGAPCQFASGEFVPGLSISASASDPHVNQGQVPANGQLYLWLTEVEFASARGGYGYGNVYAVFGGGMNVIATLNKWAHLVNHIHFKDFSGNGPEPWAQMGTGKLDFHQITEWLTRRNYDGWIICEDEAHVAVDDPDGVTLQNGAWCKENLAPLV